MMQKVGKHPNIVRLFGACVLDKSQIMVMEYVPCGDLVIISIDCLFIGMFFLFIIYYAIYLFN